jgi:hypothetical protein
MQNGQANPSNQVLIKPSRGAKSHAPECKWVLGVTEGKPSTYKLVPAHSIPVSVGRCRWCGGGR